MSPARPDITFLDAVWASMTRSFYPSLFLTTILALSAAVPAGAQLVTEGDKYLGGILKGRAPRHTPVQRAVDEDWEEYFDAVSAENANKWRFVEPERDSLDFSTLDKMYNFAVDRALPFTLHPIIREEDEPAWLRHLPAEEIRAEVEEWIAALAERYPATAYIDVVNEGPHDRLGSDELNAAFGGPGETGWDDVRAIYRLADEYFPDAQLMLTDYDVIKGQVGDFNIIPIYDEVVRVLVADGTLDALGPQGHFLGGQQYDSAWVARRLNELSANSGGLPIHITEFDLNSESDDYQLLKYRQVIPAMWTHPDVQGITFWGHYEGGTWLDHSHIVREGGSERPAMAWLKDYMRGPDKPAGRHEAEAHDAMYGFRRTGGTGGTYLNPDATQLTAMLGKDSSFLSFRHVDMAGVTNVALRYRVTGAPVAVAVVLDDQRNEPLASAMAPATEGEEWAELVIPFPTDVDGVRDVFFEVRGAEATGASFELDHVELRTNIVSATDFVVGDFEAFPNPTSGERIAVRFPEALDAAAAAVVTDVSGRVVHAERLASGTQTHELDFGGGLAAGMYQLSINTGGQLAVTRFLVGR